MIRVSKPSVLLDRRGWWNKDYVVRSTESQVDIFKRMYANRVDEDDLGLGYDVDCGAMFAPVIRDHRSSGVTDF